MIPNYAISCTRIAKDYIKSQQLKDVSERRYMQHLSCKRSCSETVSEIQEPHVKAAANSGKAGSGQVNEGHILSNQHAYYILIE